MEGTERVEAEAIDRRFLRMFQEFITGEEHSASETIDMRGFKFPRIKFPATVSKALDLRFAVFCSEAEFAGTEFRERADFDLAKFFAHANFEVVRFRKSVSFRGVDFGTHEEPTTVTFLNAEFDHGANFTHSQFHHAQFSGSKFNEHGPAMFGETRFAEVAAFSDVTFSSQTIFRSDFAGEAIFERCKFLSQASFSGSHFRRQAEFRDAEFRLAEFRKTKFAEEAQFEGGKCERYAVFTYSTFDGNARFGGRAFEQGASFENCTFNGRFTANGTELKLMTSFASADFNHEADFRGCTFGAVTFTSAIFAKLTKFSNAVFIGPANFAAVNLSEEMQFINDANAFGFHDECNFRNVNVQPGARIIFRNTNLEKASFLHTDLTGFRFRT
jgi:uncharacterized protein YjbI with pentapeptide repeats